MPRPSRFAVRFMVMNPNASPSLSSAGNSSRSSGADKRASSVVSPLFSAIFMIPDQSVRMPASVRSNSTASAPLSTIAEERFSLLPNRKEQTTLMITSRLQMTFSIKCFLSQVSME